jgi:diguanylate cyclase (GGDEF)-like protein/PAS domain S-box-containing protein
VPLKLPRLSLKVQLAFGGGLAVFVCVALLTAILLHASRKDLIATLSVAHNEMVAEKAQHMDDHLRDILRSVGQHAGVLSGKRQLPTPEDLGRYFEERPAFRSLFTTIFVTGPDGIVLYDHPATPSRRGFNFSSREYFQAVLRTGQPVISDPVRNKSNGEPVIVFAAPIRSTQGELIGVLMGSINMLGSNFIGELRTDRFAQHGFYSLVAKGKSPFIVQHPLPAQMLQKVPARDENPQLWAALEGFEGTVQQQAGDGGASLVTYKTLTEMPWILVASYPSERAHAALDRSRTQALSLALLLGSLASVMIWLFAAGLLRPLERLRSGIEANIGRPQHMRSVMVGGSPEIAAVSAAFNDFIDMRERVQQALEASEGKVRAILTQAADAFISINAAGRITEWNRQAEETLGWTREEALGQDLAELIIPHAQREAHQQGIARFRHTGAGPVVGQRIEVQAMHRTGRLIPVELSVVGQRSPDGWAANAFLRDITERKAAEERLRESEKRIRAIADNSPVLIAYIDSDHMLRFCNATYHAWFKRPLSEIVDRPVEHLVGTDGFAQRLPHLERALGGERVQFVQETTTPEGLRVLDITYVPDPDEQGRVRGVHAFAVDVTAAKLAEQQLQRLARFDSLTGLANRRHFEERLDQAMARCRRSEHPMALLFLDVDHFKQINDTLGHAAGDDVLRELASRLNACVRGTDLVARLAGDEFVVILEGLKTTAEADLVAQKVLDALQPAFSILGEPLQVGVCIGIGVYRGERMTADQLMAIADTGLYSAKRGGRGRYAVGGSA